MKKAVKLSKRQFEITVPPTKSKFRNPGGRRKVTTFKVREVLYGWFIDVKDSWKARLPRSLFKAQAQFFYDNWWSQQSGEVKKQPPLTFSNKWMKGQMAEFSISLRKPNTVNSLISGHHWGSDFCPLIGDVHLLESLTFFTFCCLGRGSLKVLS